MNTDQMLSELSPEQLSQNVWVCKLTVREAHQNWRECLNAARSGVPVVIQDTRNNVEPVGIVPWRYVLILERLNLLPSKTPRLPLSDNDVIQLKEAYNVLYNAFGEDSKAMDFPNQEISTENLEEPNLSNTI